MTQRYRVLFLILAIAMPITGHAKECFDMFVPWCQFITNGDFDNGGSGWSSNAFFTTANRCNATNEPVVQLENTEYIEQTFYVDDTFSSFSVGYELFLLNDTNNWYDELKITVTNLSTNATELRRVRGSAFNSTCAAQGWQLSGNYSNVWVKVRFEAGTYTLGTWEVDRVQFSAIY
jgi:hypothetical protein